MLYNDMRVIISNVNFTKGFDGHYMTPKQNYQIMLDKTINEIVKQGTRPSLLLHACCAPCSSYVLEYLNEYFDITVFFCNPNITEETEYKKRAAELERFISQMPKEHEINLMYGKYEPKEFFDIARGLESAPEGGERCFKCYRLRLTHTAKAAKENGFDFFTTTLSISPHKNAAELNEAGAQLSAECGVSYLFSDFKKKNGYKRSCELSAKYGLYRQNYCGCIFSKREAKLRQIQDTH